jgi:hypothetical protein
VTEERFVAVLEGDDRNPAIVAAVNVKDKSIMVLQVSSAPQFSLIVGFEISLIGTPA